MYFLFQRIVSYLPHKLEYNGKCTEKALMNWPVLISVEIIITSLKLDASCVITNVQVGDYIERNCDEFVKL